MKTRTLIPIIILTLLLAGCSKNEDPTPKVVHTGDKWIITSVDYSLVDQHFNPVSMTVDAGTVSNAGAFYFDNGNGSFDITIKSTHLEDYFSYDENDPDISIVSIDQNAGGGTFSQNVISLSGSKDPDTLIITVEGSIIKQSTSGQFTLTGTFTLEKE